MKKLIGGIACIALALSLVAGPAAAQLHGNPTYAITSGTGFTILADYGRGLNDDSFKPNYFGGRVALGLPMVSFWAGAGSTKADDVLDPGGQAEIAFAGGAAVNIVKGPLVPVFVALQANAGVLSEEGWGSTVYVPVGLVIAINIPAPTVDVKPWVMPRAELQRFSPDMGDSQSELGFGFSAGLDVTLPNGLGFHIAGDWLTIDDPTGIATGKVKPGLVGGGIHYKIAIPSLGVPIM
jgi:hypothetical protein